MEVTVPFTVKAAPPVRKVEVIEATGREGSEDVWRSRAMAARPRLLLFDSPTSGLDPITARTVDAEIIKLRDLEHVTSILVTHQLEDAFYVAGHEAIRENGRLTIVPADQPTANDAEFLMLKDGSIHFEGSAAELQASKDAYLKRFLA